MSPIISDYHMHTPLCGHAKGDPQMYAQHAVTTGLREIGFTDHAPLFTHRDPTISMDHSQLPVYHHMIESVRSEFADKLTVRVGIEADYIPGYEERTKKMLAEYPYDYVIGSVHFMEKWGFDDPIQMKEWSARDVNEVYREYHRLLRKSALSRLFDILGHVDLVKKFNFRPTIDITSEIEENARVFKRTGVVIEINSSGLRKPAQEIYPSLHDLKIYQAKGVPITFGSDAHEPTDVGRDFDKSLELARAAGYTEYVQFEGRKIARTIKW
ncbi:MAG: histidinol-phosphatase HisJ [Candidatus Omnitrophica bacterium]|nr:histidinol-phosphatase HisJ [Candidatus Omnitrophota bacterium]